MIKTLHTLVTSLKMVVLSGFILITNVYTELIKLQVIDCRILTQAFMGLKVNFVHFLHYINQ